MVISRWMALISLVVLVGSPVLAFADSIEVDGPGFKVEKRTGWFGRQSTQYSDALGNQVHRSRGFLGRTTTDTQIFGTQTTRRGQNVSVTAPNGAPLVSTRRTFFGGRQTKVSGSNILGSFKGLWNGMVVPPAPTTQ